MQEARRDALIGGEAYAPRSSGLLKGSGGLHQFRRRKSAIKGWGKNFPDRHMSDLKAIREQVPDFDEALEQDYTRRELMLMAEKILLSDRREEREHPAILNAPMYRFRLKHEIYVANGIPDPAIEEGLYWRTHPQGRPFSTPELMLATGCGFYDGVQQTDREIVEVEAVVLPPREVRRCIGPECDREVVGRSDYCPGHRTQYYSGKPLMPLRRGDQERLATIRATWDSGESDAAVARRFEVGQSYVAKLRRQGRAEAAGKILRAEHETLVDASG